MRATRRGRSPMKTSTRSSSTPDTATRENYPAPSDPHGVCVAATRYTAPATGAAPPRRTHALDFFSTSQATPLRQAPKCTTTSTYLN